MGAWGWGELDRPDRKEEGARVWLLARVTEGSCGLVEVYGLPGVGHCELAQPARVWQGRRLSPHGGRGNIAKATPSGCQPGAWGRCHSPSGGP